MIKKVKQVLFLALSVTLVTSCNQTDHAAKKDTSTSGTITIAADESLKPIIEAEEEMFEALYPNAQINIIYTNEFEAIQLLNTDSVRIAIVTRTMLPEEQAPFDQRKISPKNIIIGYDAIGVIMHPNRKDTVLTLTQLSAIMNGTYSTWKDINANNSPAPLKVVFDNAQSGAIRHIKDSLLQKGELAKHCYALSSNPNVINQVEQDENAIGIIGVSWISDKHDTTSNNFLNRIKVVSLVPKNPETAETKTMKPYQAYIALKQYPLYRAITIINPEGRYGLGTGFASFINSDKGQRIILKSGLVPANAPVRIIQLN